MINPFAWAKQLPMNKAENYFMLSCLIGVGLSYYSLLVEMKFELDKSYKAYCDISAHMSCTKAFGSRFGRGFGFIGLLLGENSVLNQPNGLLGMVFYSLLFTFGKCRIRYVAWLQLILTSLSIVLSVYLALILTFVLNDFCLVCITTYIINFVNLSISLRRWKLLKREHRD